MAGGIEYFAPALPWAYFGLDDLEQFSTSEDANKTYQYDNITDFRHEWANTVDAQVAIGAEIIDQKLDNSTFFKPIKAVTEAGVKTAYITGTMTIDEITGKVTVVTDGVMIGTAPLRDAVGSALNAFGMELAGTDKNTVLTQLGVQVASKLLNRVVTADELGNIYVLNKLVYRDEEMQSYVDMQTLQAMYEALTEAGAIPKIEIEDYEIDEPIQKSAISVISSPQQTISNAMSGFLGCQPAIGETMSTTMELLRPYTSLLGAQLGSHVSSAYPYVLVRFQANLAGTEANKIFAWIWMWDDTTMPKWWKYLNKILSQSGSYFYAGELAFSLDDDHATWHDSSDYSSAVCYGYKLSFENLIPTVTAIAATGTAMWTGIYKTVATPDSQAKSICGNWLSGEEIDNPGVQKQEDLIYPPIADIPIDDLWPGWLERALDGSRYNAEDDVVVKAPALPIDIAGDRDDVITRDWDDVRAGILDPALALAGAYAGILSLTDIYDLLNRVKAMDGTDAIDITADPTPTPTPVIPGIPTLTGNAKLYTVHQMNSGQLDALGSYMWSSDFISLIEHMFSDPAQAVIGLHTLYYGGSLPIGSAEQIKLGSIPATGVTGQPVTNRYMSFSCGSVTVPNYYGNVEDYDPYTKVQIWLPFIGFRDLSTNEVMGGTITVTYGIDVYTGACVANITIARDGVTQALYSFDGNCALTEPMTGADYSRVISGIISLGVGIATGVASGGVGAAIGAGALLANNKISYSRSGALSANAGAMCIKTPYILVRRPRAYDANLYESFYGNPANNTVYLSQCSGYTRVKDIHVDTIACTDDERLEIERLLKLGVIL